MTISEIFSITKETIMDLRDFDGDDITEMTTFENLGLDSLDFIELQVSVRKHFGILMDQELFVAGENQIKNMGQMCEHIRHLKSAQEHSDAV